MAEIRTIALEAVRQRGQADAQTLAERAVAGEADGTELTAADFAADTYIDLKTKPTTGNFACFIPAGSIS